MNHSKKIGIGIHWYTLLYIRESIPYTLYLLYRKVYQVLYQKVY